MFFKRHAPNREKTHPCRWNGHCEININTRQVCAACRLDKCFNNGMQTELIRCPLSKTSKRKNSNPTTDQSNRTAGQRNENMQVSRIASLNLLERDQSTLTGDQWNRISNLVHCFDEHSGLDLVRKYFSEQNLLPVKMRFKIQSVGKFLATNLVQIQRVLERNGDYLSLAMEDRLALLRHTIRHSTTLGGAYLVYLANAADDPCFYQASEILFGAKPMAVNRTVSKFFDPDPTVMKLMLPIISFSTISYTVYRNQLAQQFRDLKQILRIQDFYVELAWRYMIYRYSYRETVRRFSQIVRCLFSVTCTLVEVNRVVPSINIIDDLTRSAERMVTMTD